MPRLSEQERAERRNGMGSTCIVEANGLAPWKGAGPMRLYCEKMGIASPDPTARHIPKTSSRPHDERWAFLHHGKTGLNAFGDCK